MARTKAGRKVEPGRCTVCGCAVVRVTPLPGDPDGYHGGHLWVDGELLDVRCERHIPESARGTACWPTGPWIVWTPEALESQRRRKGE